MKETVLTPIGSSVFSVKICAHDNGNYTGEYTTPHSSSVEKFNSLSSLVLIIDSTLDVEEENHAVLFTPNFDFKSDMDIEILFRQHGTWQGRVKFVREGQETTFRSVLELLWAIETVFGE